jgi:hypothetical protein
MYYQDKRKLRLIFYVTIGCLEVIIISDLNPFSLSTMSVCIHPDDHAQICVHIY